MSDVGGPTPAGRLGTQFWSLENIAKFFLSSSFPLSTKKGRFDVAFHKISIKIKSLNPNVVF